MTRTPPSASHPRLYLLATAAGFCGLIAWFVIGRKLGILDWISQLFPASHAGAGVMLAVMLLMTPGFLVWKYYNRWIERRLQVKGRYYEDDFYRDRDAK